MPSLNNENDSDGDDDMSGAESQHSGSSRDPKADSSEADEPDSDSSELDENECERRTAGFVKYMGKLKSNTFSLSSRAIRGIICVIFYISLAGDLEQQFTILREQLYQERIKQIETHLSDVRNGRSQEYLEPLKRLTDNMQNRIEVAGVLKKLRMENIQHKFLAEEQGANQHFEVSAIHFGFDLPENCLCILRSLISN